jgi:hypothetical protein
MHLAVVTSGNVGTARVSADRITAPSESLAFHGCTAKACSNYSYVDCNYMAS